MLHGLEAFDMIVDAIFTQTDLAAVAELLDRIVTVHITGDEVLRPGGRCSHI
jgi:hypothetical protein